MMNRKIAEKKRNLGNIVISIGVAMYVFSLAVFFLFSWYDRSPIGLVAKRILLLTA